MFPFGNAPQQEGKFQIDPNTGDLRLFKPLDYEKTKAYELTLVAENAAKVALKAYTTLRIQIQDVNDEPPLFSLTR